MHISEDNAMISIFICGHQPSAANLAPPLIVLEEKKMGSKVAPNPDINIERNRFLVFGPSLAIWSCGLCLRPVSQHALLHARYKGWEKHRKMITVASAKEKVYIPIAIWKKHS